MMLSLVSTLFLCRRALIHGQIRCLGTNTGLQWVEDFSYRFFCWNGARKKYTKLVTKNNVQDQLLKPIQFDQLAPNVLDNLEKIKLFHVGGNGLGFEYNPVFFSAQHCPNIWDLSNLKRVVSDLDEQSFDVVCLSAFLTRFPNPDERLQVIQLIQKLIRKPGYGGKHIHRSGLLCVVESNNVFRDTAGNECIIGKAVYNKELIYDWRELIDQSGFDCIDQRVLYDADSKVNGNYSFVFKSCGDTIIESKKLQVHPPSAFPSSEQLYYLRDEGRKETFGGAYGTRKLWSMLDFRGDAMHHIDAQTSQCDSLTSCNLRTVSSLKPVAIIGGGLGGTALALALRRKGVPIAVFEKDDSFSARKQGYALTIQQGNGALKQLGIPNGALDDIGATSYAHTSLSSDGLVLGSYSAQGSDERMSPGSQAISTRKIRVFACDSAQFMDKSSLTTNKRLFSGRHNIHLPRQALRKVLMTQLESNNRGVDSFHWGKKLTSFLDQGDEGVLLAFEDGSKFQASVVVAADGIHSVVRKMLGMKSDGGGALGQQLKYLGLIVILGISPTYLFCNTRHPKEEEVVHCDYFRRSIQWLDGTSRIFTMPYDAMNTMWQLSFPINEPDALEITDKGALLKELALATVGTWDNAVRELVERTHVDLISGHPAYDRDPITPQDLIDAYGMESRITLLGDAAHPMSPFKGQGANQALLDAVSLAKNLFSSQLCRPGIGIRTIPTALREYEQEMCCRSKNKVLGSRAAAEYLHSRDALAVGDITRSAAAELQKHKCRKN